MGTRCRLMVPLVVAAVTLSSLAGAQSKPATSKPAAKPAHAHKPASTKPPARTPDNGIRRQVAGGPTLDDTQIGADTPELRALYAAERELFPPAAREIGAPWPSELPLPVASGDDRPRVHASGLPPTPPPSAPPATSETSAKDL